MKRRDVMAGAAAAAIPPSWFVAASARAQAATPVIGLLGGSSPSPQIVAWWLEGLAQNGFDVGRNLAVAYRWADNRPERLPALTQELLRLPVVLIVAIQSGAPAQAAKAATSSVPIVFEVGADPVASGLVASLARPGGNLTGVHLFTADLNAKRISLLREMLPRASTLAVLLNPNRPGAQDIEAEITRAAAQVGMSPVIARVTNEGGFDAAFARFGQQRVDALIVSNDPFFSSHHEALVALALRHRLPAVYESRNFAAAGGLMSYGADRGEVFRQLGAITARVLKGDRPAELPVLQPTRFELVINRRTANALGLTIPQALLLRADEVIE